MTNLVTCEKLGSSLLGWLANASPEELARFCELTKCGITQDNLGQSLIDWLEQASKEDKDRLCELLNCGIHIGEGQGLAGSGTAEDPLKVIISQQGGNLIDMRDDGLYYGQEAAADVANLYVANEGDDGATGTREAPLRTIGEAVKRQKPNTRFTVHLKEGQTHELRSSWADNRWNNLGWTMIPYGAQVDGIMSRIIPGPGYEGTYSIKEYTKPKVKFIADATILNGGATYNYPHLTEHTGPLYWEFIGIEFDMTYIPSVAFLDFRSGMIGSHIGQVNIHLYGCSIIEGEYYNLIEIGAESNVRIGNVHLAKDGSAKLIKIVNSGTVDLEFQENGGYTEGLKTPAEWGVPELTLNSSTATSDYHNQIQGIKGINTANVTTTANIGA